MWRVNEKKPSKLGSIQDPDHDHHLEGICPGNWWMASACLEIGDEFLGDTL
jgi:hypothetical protein